jgi:hypothetical protein
MSRRVVWYLFIDVSEVLADSITYKPVDGGSKHLSNVGKLLPDYTAQQKTFIFKLNQHY